MTAFFYFLCEFEIFCAKNYHYTDNFFKNIGGMQYGVKSIFKEKNGNKALSKSFKVKGIAPEKVAAYAETLLNNRGGIGRYSTFTHIDVRAEKARWRG